MSDRWFKETDGILYQGKDMKNNMAAFLASLHAKAEKSEELSKAELAILANNLTNYLILIFGDKKKLSWLIMNKQARLRKNTTWQDALEQIQGYLGDQSKIMIWAKQKEQGSVRWSVGNQNALKALASFLGEFFTALNLHKEWLVAMAASCS